MDGLLDQAVESGKKVSDIVKMALTEAGFVIVKEPLVQKNLGVQFPFAVTDSVEGRLWYIEVSGAFTTSRPGMRRADVLWKTLGRAHVLVSSYIGQEAIERPRLLILTPRLPKSGSDGDRALRAVGGSGFFDALEIFDTASSSRLSSYATQIVDRPLPGFWTEAEISDQFA